MSTFRGRAPSGLISRETGNYAWVGENGEIIVDGPHCLSDNGENLLAVDPTDKGITLNRSSMTDFVKSVAPGVTLTLTSPPTPISMACLSRLHYASAFAGALYRRHYVRRS